MPICGPVGPVAEIEVHKRDGAITDVGQRSVTIGGDSLNGEAGVLYDLLDFQCDENLVLYDQNLLAHSTARKALAD